MFVKKFSWSGSVLTFVYTAFFGYALWSTAQACPSFLCDLLLLLATIPWSLVFEPQYNIFDLTRPAGFFGMYGISTVFFSINAIALYCFGSFMGRFFDRRLRAGKVHPEA